MAYVLMHKPVNNKKKNHQKTKQNKTGFALSLLLYATNVEEKANQIEHSELYHICT